MTFFSVQTRLVLKGRGGDVLSNLFQANVLTNDRVSCEKSVAGASMFLRKTPFTRSYKAGQNCPDLCVQKGQIRPFLNTGSLRRDPTPSSLKKSIHGLECMGGGSNNRGQ